MSVKNNVCDFKRGQRWMCIIKTINQIVVPTDSRNNATKSSCDFQVKERDRDVYKKQYICFSFIIIQEIM